MAEVFNHLSRIASVMGPVFYKLLAMSVSAACAGAAVLFIRKLADRRIPPLWKYLLWMPMLFALLFPYRLQSGAALLPPTTDIETISYRGQYDVGGAEPKNALQESPYAAEGRASHISWKSVVFEVALPLAWALGMFGGIAFLIASRAALSHKIKRHTVGRMPYGNLLAECKEKLGIKAGIEVIVQGYLPSPALMGIFRAKILLPAYCGRMSEENISYILLHELSHFKRKDMLLNYLLLALQAIYWFNPFIWIGFKRLREDMELLNDVYVLRHIGSEKSKSYARSLVEVLACSHNISPVPKLLCMVDGKKSVERRLYMIKRKENFQKHKLVIAVSCILLIGAVGGLFLTQRGNAHEARELTQNEVDEVNQAFEQLIPSSIPGDEYMINPICHFFGSYYGKPEEIDLEQFIWYIQGGEELHAGDPGDASQFEALKELEAFPFKNIETIADMPVPLQRKPVSQVNEILERYAGIHADAIQNRDNVLYLPEPYDSFYTYTSDAGWGGFTCIGGEAEGNTVRLFSESATLTLEKKGEKYFIVSHMETEPGGE